MTETPVRYETGRNPKLPIGWTCLVDEYGDREEWLDARRSCIGASDVAAIFGYGYANQSPLSVWASKVGISLPEPDPPARRRMELGRRMEPVIAAEFSEETGIDTNDPGDFTIFRHELYHWMGATIDRIAMDPEHGPIPLELKHVNGRFRHEWDPDIGPPMKFEMQVQHQMFVSGAPCGYLAGLVGGDELCVFRIARDWELTSALFPHLERFWELVVTQQQPPVDDNPATRTALRAIYPRDTEPEIILPPEAIQWDRQLLELKEKEKAIKAAREALESRFFAAIGNARGGILPTCRYSWKWQEKKEHTVKATSYRVLRRHDA